MKKTIISLLTLVSTISTLDAVAYSPTIQIVFSDINNICLDDNNHTAFKFTYNYNANKDFEYYSGINDVTEQPKIISVPTPTAQGYTKNYAYNYFAISSAGDCGKREFNYVNTGNCYVKNIIPSDAQNKPFSYKITVIPEATDEEPYGTKTYNLNCMVSKMN